MSEVDIPQLCQIAGGLLGLDMGRLVCCLQCVQKGEQGHVRR